jgi:hypothetical protein
MYQFRTLDEQMIVAGKLYVMGDGALRMYIGCGTVPGTYLTYYWYQFCTIGLVKYADVPVFGEKYLKMCYRMAQECLKMPMQEKAVIKCMKLEDIGSPIELLMSVEQMKQWYVQSKLTGANLPAINIGETNISFVPKEKMRYICHKALKANELVRGKLYIAVGDYADSVSRYETKPRDTWLYCGVDRQGCLVWYHNTDESGAYLLRNPKQTLRWARLEHTKRPKRVCLLDDLELNLPISGINLNLTDEEWYELCNK